MGSVSFPSFALVMIISAFLDHHAFSTPAFYTLLGWRSFTFILLGLSAWYCLANRKTLSPRRSNTIIGLSILTVLVNTIPVSMVYIEQTGRSQHLLQVGAFSVVALLCVLGPMWWVLTLAVSALASVLFTDYLASIPSQHLTQDALSMLVVVASAVAGNVVWGTRSREAYLLTLALTKSEEELRKLRESQARSAQLALHRRNAEWTALVSQAPVIVLNVDRTQVISFANHKAQSFGFFVGDLIEGVSAKIDGPWLGAQVRSVLEDLKTRSFELALGSTKKEQTHWTFYAAPIGTQAPVEQVTLVGINSTEAWRLRSQLRRKSRETSLGSFVTSISHDFNNLLTVIVGSAELLDLTSQSTEDRQALVHSILDAAQRADDLIRRMLSFVRGSDSRPEYHDLNGLIDDMSSLLRYVSGVRNRFAFCPSPSPIRVRIDKTELEQILVNLCSNANSAIEGSGDITITTTLDAQKTAHIRVHDSGCGISKEVQRRIFDPYFTTRAEKGGSGVGLATVRSLVESAGGSIHVDSSPGHGTQMTISLPSAQEQLPAQAPPKALSGTNFHLPKTALVVDENPQTRALARSMLERMGCSTAIAANQQSAIEQASAGPSIELMITDFRHSLQEALDLQASIKAQHPKLATVYATGHIDNLALLERIQELDLVILQKPYTSLDIARAIERASKGDLG